MMFDFSFIFLCLLDTIINDVFNKDNTTIILVLGCFTSSRHTVGFDKWKKMACRNASDNQLIEDSCVYSRSLRGMPLRGFLWQ